MQLTASAYKPSNYKSFSRPRIPTKMVSEARESNLLYHSFLLAPEAAFACEYFCPPRQPRGNNHLREKIRWETNRTSKTQTYPMITITPIHREQKTPVSNRLSKASGQTFEKFPTSSRIPQYV
jgi:hypothetical protein